LKKSYQPSSGWEDDGGWGGNDEEWNFDDLEKPRVKNGIDYNTFNLNKLDDWELQKHKKIMDQEFQKRQVKPTDPGFVYDKRMEFQRAEEGDDSWDEN